MSLHNQPNNNNSNMPGPILSHDGTIMNEWYMQCETDQNSSNLNSNNNINNTNNSSSIFSNLYSAHARTPIMNYT